MRFYKKMRTTAVKCIGQCELDSPNMHLKFHQVIESRLDQIDEIVQRVMTRVRRMPGARRHLEEVTLALAEAVANAVIHGNRSDPGKKITICGGCENGRTLVLVITDEGEGFDPSGLPDPTVSENIFATHGRGVFLIKQLMDQAEYRKGGRQLVLRKRLS
ncbi:MAG TPA: ATP-binding protein [Bryobacterales bacterium]|jgi:serine/threonine-protein kinase RsbW|nr:ATP-binding protein [Bryobacterales bacterium]